MSTRGMGSVYQRGGVWWVGYFHQGTKHRESSGSAKKADAVKLLKRRLEEAGKGRPAREAERVLMSDLKQLVDADYFVNGRRIGARFGQAWAHLVGFFGEKERAVSITAPRIAAYVTSRTEAGAAPNTVKNEVGALKRAFNLARKTGTLLPNEVPAAYPTIRGSRARMGFFERPEHDAVRKALPPDEGDVAEYLYWTGWRKGEALGLRWSDVDEKARVLRIETTKTGEPRTLPYGALPQLVALIEHRRKVTDAVQAKRDMIVSHVFHRNGESITTFYRSWAAACVKAGLGREERAPDVLDADGKLLKRGRLLRRIIARIPHDYRQSAARNLSRAGVPERVIMTVCGWKTRSVFDRYRIVAEVELSEGLAKLAEAVPQPEPSKVVRIDAVR